MTPNGFYEITKRLMGSLVWRLALPRAQALPFPVFRRVLEKSVPDRTSLHEDLPTAESSWLRRAAIMWRATAPWPLGS